MMEFLAFVIYYLTGSCAILVFRWKQASRITGADLFIAIAFGWLWPMFVLFVLLMFLDELIVFEKK